MPDAPAPKEMEIKRIVFREIVEGDLRKFKAESNDSDSGGGARDLRFRPFDQFIKVFREIFPATRKEMLRRGGQLVPVDIQVGHLSWLDAAEQRQSKEATFHPPTDPRPEEGRIPVVHTYPPFNSLPPMNQGKVVVLLIQRADDSVWPAFATEASLNSGQWDVEIATFILNCLAAERNARSVARGYIDLVSGRRYADATVQ